MNELIRELVEAVAAARKAHEGLFSQCLSNAVYNQWGGQVDWTELNKAGELASETLIAKARAYLETGGWTKVEDGLPVVPESEPHVNVWVCLSEEGHLLRTVWARGDGRGMFPRMTHWRYAEPTPEPPKG